MNTPESRPDEVPAEGAKKPGVFSPLRWIRQLHEEGFKAGMAIRQTGFSQIKTISDEEKKLIKNRVNESNKRIVSLEAWKNILVDSIAILTFIALIVGLIIALKDETIWPTANHSWYEWIVVYSIVLIGTVPAAFLSFRAEVSESAGLWTIVLFTLSVFLMRLFADTGIHWLPRTLYDGVSGALVASSVFFGIILIYIFLSRLVSFPFNIRMHQRYTEDDIIDTLTWALAKAESDESNWHSYQVKKSVMFALEDIAQRIEKDLPLRNLSQDAVTKVWLRKQSKELARGVRKLKRFVLLPAEGDRDRLIAGMRELFISTANGYWAKLEDTDQNQTGNNTWAERILSSFQLFLSIAIPAMIFYVINFASLPIDIEDKVKDSINTVVIGWIILKTINFIDPKAENNLKEIDKAVDFVKK